METDYLPGIAVLDFETTNLDGRTGAVLSAGMVAYKSGVRTFYHEYYPFDGADITQQALDVNGFDPDKIARIPENNPRNMPFDVIGFMRSNDCITVAGQNPCFDVSFLNAYSDRYSSGFGLHRGLLDLHSVCVSVMFSKGIALQRRAQRGDSALTLDWILRFVGLGTEPKPHNALNGARYEFEAFCRLIYGKSVMQDLKKFAIPEILLQ